MLLCCVFTSEDREQADNVAAESWLSALFDERRAPFD